MPRRFDVPLYLSFEELERDELRRAEAMGGAIEDLFDGMFADDLRPDLHPAEPPMADDADDEE